MKTSFPKSERVMTRIIVGRLTHCLIFIVALGVAMAGLACGASSSPADKKNDTYQARDDKVLRWKVISVTPPRTIKAGGSVGYCVGDPRPRIKRPQIKYRGANVYIKLEVEKPRPKSTEKHTACGGVELLVRRTIILRRNLSDVQIYDSGVEPPKLRWPK
jgi:hypothetical protein